MEVLFLRELGVLRIRRGCTADLVRKAEFWGVIPVNRLALILVVCRESISDYHLYKFESPKWRCVSWVQIIPVYAAANALGPFSCAGMAKLHAENVRDALQVRACAANWSL